MKITDVQTQLLTGPCTLDPYLSQARRVRSAAFIEVHTDAGVHGLGETYAGYFCPEVVPAIVEFFKPILVGQGVDNIPELWRRMYHCGNFWCRVGLGIELTAATKHRFPFVPGSGEFNSVPGNVLAEEQEARKQCS